MNITLNGEVDATREDPNEINFSNIKVHLLVIMDSILLLAVSFEGFQDAFTLSIFYSFLREF